MSAAGPADLDRDWFPLVVHRRRALYGAWYEFFPRSEGATFDPMGRQGPTSGTFRTAMKRLPDRRHGLRRRLPPALTPDRDHVPGARTTPWTPGRTIPGRRGRRVTQGGHDAIHPDLGTLEDFDAFVAYAATTAWSRPGPGAQCSPTTLGEFASPSGSPPAPHHRLRREPAKKPPGHLPLNFDHGRSGLYGEVKRIVQHWMNHGVRIFPHSTTHTKPVAFWERLLADIGATDPDVLFLAEAFTPPRHDARPKPGSTSPAPPLPGAAPPTNSPTAFQARPDRRHTCGPAPSPTPRHPHLISSTTGLAFEIRAILAALYSPPPGASIRAELCEAAGAPRQRGLRLDTSTGPATGNRRPRRRHHRPLITQLNTLRNTTPALQQLPVTTSTIDQRTTAFSKRPWTTSSDRGQPQPPPARGAFTVHLDLPALGLPTTPTTPPPSPTKLDGATYTWTQASFVRLDPLHQPAHILVPAERRTMCGPVKTGPPGRREHGRGERDGGEVAASSPGRPEPAPGGREDWRKDRTGSAPLSRRSADGPAAR